MPVERMLHPRAGHSEKVSGLTDFEYRVWTQYILSADDYGVMRLSAITVQDGNYYLASKPAKIVQRALDRLVSVGLVMAFEHQRRRFCCQHDWQEYQNVRHPRSTHNPLPPTNVLDQCDDDTRALFQKHSGKVSEIVPEDSGKKSETFPPLARAGTRETLPLTQTLPQTPPTRAHTTALIERPKNHGECLAHGPVCFRPFIASKYLARFGGDHGAMVAWAVRTCARDQDRVERGERVSEGDDFAYWAARYDEEFKRTTNAKTAGNVAAAQRFVARGQQ